MCRGGMLITSRLSSPRLAASRCSAIASMCQFETNGVAGSTSGQASAKNVRRLRRASSARSSALDGSTRDQLLERPDLVIRQAGEIERRAAAAGRRGALAGQLGGLPAAPALGVAALDQRQRGAPIVGHGLADQYHRVDL